MGVLLFDSYFFLYSLCLEKEAKLHNLATVDDLAQKILSKFGRDC